MLECFTLIEQLGGHCVHWTYDPRNRVGDHVCYISNLSKLRQHFPSWSITRPLASIVEEMIRAEEERLVAT